MAEIRSIIHCSSSIENWREKILKRFKAKDYKWPKDLFKPVIFFGLYRPKDFLLFFCHRGKKICHWCGSDILAAGWHYRWLQKIKAKHICETEIEQGILRLMLQQEVEVRPTFLSNPDEFPISYQQSKTPEVFIHINRNAERESGFFALERVAKRLPYIKFHIYGKMAQRPTEHNIVFHGFIPEEQFNRDIKKYHGALDFHEFSGFSEVIAKSILLGQYPISKVRYPLVDTFKDENELVRLLDDLKNKKEPNYKVRNYYLNQFENSIWNFLKLGK